MKINLDTVADDAQIQIIPMIDVIFCILTFFILAALQLTRQQGINVDIPKAKSGVVQMRQMLVVSIDASGQTFIDQNMVDRAQLFTLLKQYREKNADGLLVLNASQNAFYNDVIQVLDVLRSVGGDKVALATIPAPSINPGTNQNGAGPLGLPSNSPGLFPSGNAGSGLQKLPSTTDPLLPGITNPLVTPMPFPPGTVLPSNPSQPETGSAPSNSNVEPSPSSNSAAPDTTVTPAP
ncbi:biopolymer transporter ExbD [filamentous cyanobacterium LEGE 11480]|uniref:Biopolymer transporter ExbD n=1 Tax=Romeriopsis navalis LEGE 11480 TaxID=2777977 RepID=A0A928VMK0_9CYAN|nr:biopolymer transporter ExbD [Romeriopsis navalis]MBE9028614.1 biopolymer transporter ExbD [Romeriopsis navalis LEGE 11480]